MSESPEQASRSGCPANYWVNRRVHETGWRDIPFGRLAVVGKLALISLRSGLVSSLAHPDSPPDLAVYPDIGPRYIYPAITFARIP
jgi:hypothetical protein